MAVTESGVESETGARNRTSLGELCALFARLGSTAFGGPAVHIALMHREVVQVRKWLSEQQFLDLLGATNLIPGPNSTEMALHIGWQRRGLAGLLTAGLSFIVPAMLITLGLAVVYVRYGTIPRVASLLYGIKPVMLAVVLAAVAQLAKKALPGWSERLLASVAMAAVFLGIHELIVLFGMGLLAVCVARIRGGRDAQRDSQGDSSLSVLPLLPALPLGSAVAAQTANLPSVFLLFFKIGSVLYGSGYVLLAFLRADLVQRLGWLSESQLMDAIAVGQMTPGPVFTTATFVGYLLQGTSGALVATVGIFLPAFVLVALSGPLVPRLRSLPSLGVFLDGVSVGSWALMAAVTIQLGRSALCDVPAVLIALGSLLALLRFQVNTTYLLLTGAGLGLLFHEGSGILRFF